jgi:uncharacterized protein YdiU (UPF0061 family)
VLSRVAASHIRVGTFQYFAARRDLGSLRALYDYTVARHYPHVEDPAHLLSEVIGRQASLVARWLSVGFIHGVMNTDNTAISGETTRRRSIARSTRMAAMPMTIRPM